LRELENRLERYVKDATCPCKTLDDHLDKLQSMNNNVRDDIDLFAAALKIIGDPKRLRILYLLNEGPLCLCELEYILDLSQPTITHHVKKLKEIGVIRLEKEGRWTTSNLLDNKILGHLTALHKILLRDQS
jgi:ArsR family transcriptional regulator